MNQEIQSLINRGALFVSNHSGGKDSQAMLIKLLEIVPAKQILVVHASLGDVEWTGALELAEKQAADAQLPFIVARHQHGRSVCDYPRRRPGAPSGLCSRQPTSELRVLHYGIEE